MIPFASCRRLTASGPGSSRWPRNHVPPPRVPPSCAGTTDGGKTWTTLQGAIIAIRFANGSRGWLAMTDPTGAVDVRVTSDGGATWEGGFHDATGAVVGLDAATAQIAWLMTQDGAYCTASSCSNYELFRTVHGGGHWSSLGNPKGDAGELHVRPPGWPPLRERVARVASPQPGRRRR